MSEQQMSTPQRAVFPVSTLLTIIGLAVALMVFAVARELRLIDSDLAKRAVGILIGAVLMVTANVLPKFVRPINAQPEKSGRAMSFERFAGWTFVLTGFIYIAVWLIAPIEHVMLISSAAGLAAFGLVAAKWIRLSIQSRDATASRSNDTAGESSQRIMTARGAIVLILHAIVWVFAMILADSLWGDGVAQWMAVAFVFANGLLIAVMWGTGPFWFEGNNATCTAPPATHHSTDG